MKNKKVTMILLIVIMLLLLTGVFCMVFLQMAGDKLTAGKTDLTYFSAYTEVEEFQKVPAMVGESIKVGKTVDYGQRNYIIDISGSTYDEYKDYLKTLQSNGFQLHSSNGEDAMEGYVATTNLTKDNLVLTVMHIMKENKTYISASYDLPLSEHLNAKEEYIDGKLDIMEI